MLRGPQGTCTAVTPPAALLISSPRSPPGSLAVRSPARLGDDSLWGVKATVNTGTLGSVGEGPGCPVGRTGDDPAAG